MSQTEAQEFIGHAKCILAGEHSVLRGHPAIVFPLPQLAVKITYLHSENSSLTADYVGAYGETMLLMFWGTLKKALELIQYDLNKITGKLIIENNIPMCAGLGFSAALCIAIGRWFIAQNWIEESELFDFARTLEDRFHLESSGVDIAGAISHQGVIYRKGSIPKPLIINWHPKLYLSYSEQISVTAEAVKKVKTLFKENEILASRIDLDMAESVLMSEAALSAEKEQGFALIKNAIDRAGDCFKRWNLISEKLDQHLRQLKNFGAVAVKPTGAGEGGHALSLWAETPPKQLPFEILRLFEE